ncbi:hypothetical protein FA95DRAFT_1578557 [Auriscalpium vulgare]|uniref:Uncharacterized protein n=1 Tax=Auriscalpium vulgare TaxID=40419 RepID=A0ACB8R1Q5_9AGAM|nr:hypothetical protein FA95DRAFT_1578557 [Auriscalpium vulgare]
MVPLLGELSLFSTRLSATLLYRSTARHFGTPHAVSSSSSSSDEDREAAQAESDDTPSLRSVIDLTNERDVRFEEASDLASLPATDSSAEIYLSDIEASPETKSRVARRYGDNGKAFTRDRLVRNVFAGATREHHPPRAPPCRQNHSERPITLHAAHRREMSVRFIQRTEHALVAARLPRTLDETR